MGSEIAVSVGERGSRWGKNNCGIDPPFAARNPDGMLPVFQSNVACRILIVIGNFRFASIATVVFDDGILEAVGARNRVRVVAHHAQCLPHQWSGA